MSPRSPRTNRGEALPPLFGLAPGGVYPAAAVTGGAVRSYRTVSPLPTEIVRQGLSQRATMQWAVCFLWHFPWGHPRRPLAGTVFPWSPDFPPQTGLPRSRRSSNCLAKGDLRPHGQVVKRSSLGRNRATRPGHIEAVGARRRDRAGLAARNWDVKYKNKSK
jgi:hypothetical protein